MAETILVTGSTGTIGNEVVKQLAPLGVNIRAAVQASSKTDKILRFGAQPVVMSFDEPQSMQKALAGVDAAFLVTPVVKDQAPLASRFLQAATETGLRKLVKLSVVGADTIDYEIGRQHRKVEKEIEASGIAYTFLRANFFMQNLLGQDSIKSQSAFYDSAGDAKASDVDARDIAAVAAAALTQPGHEGKAYEVTGPEAKSNFEIAEVLSSVTGRKITYVPVSDEDVRNSMQAANMPDWLIDDLLELIAVKRAGLAQNTWPEIETLIGRKQITFEQFAREHIEAFK